MWLTFAPSFVDDHAALVGRAGGDVVHPADDVGVFMHRKEFARIWVTFVLDRTAVPWRCGDIGDGVVTGQKRLECNKNGLSKLSRGSKMIRLQKWSLNVK